MYGVSLCVHAVVYLVCVKRDGRREGGGDVPCVYTSVDLRDLCMRSMNFYDVSVKKKWYNQ